MVQEESVPLLVEQVYGSLWIGASRSNNLMALLFLIPYALDRSRMLAVSGHTGLENEDEYASAQITGLRWL